MFKDVFTLKKRAWHARMMKYIWGLDHHDFSHICPYWWLSVANCFIFIEFFTVVEGFKLIIYIFKMIFKFFNLITEPFIVSFQDWSKERNRKAEIKREAKEERKRQRDRERWEKWSKYYRENPEKLVEIKAKSYSVFDKIADNLRRWHYEDWEKIRDQVYTLEEKLEEAQIIKDAEEARLKAVAYLKAKKDKFLSIYKGDDVEALLVDGNFEDYLRKWENQKKQAEIEAEAARRRAAKDRINHILRIIKIPTTIAAYTLGTGAILFGVYWLFRFFIWTAEGFNSVHHKSWVKFGSLILAILLIILALVAGATILYLLWRGFWWLLNKWEDYRYERRQRRNISDNSVIYAERKKKTHPIDRIANVMDKIFDGLNWIGNIFVIIWNKIIVKAYKAIRSAILFLIQMIKNNCPAIEWED